VEKRPQLPPKLLSVVKVTPHSKHLRTAKARIRGPLFRSALTVRPLLSCDMPGQGFMAATNMKLDGKDRDMSARAIVTELF